MIRQLIQLAVRLLAKLEDLGVLLARLTVGLVFVHSGWGKFHHLDKVVDFFRDLGIPAPQLQAPFVAGCEVGFGALLIAGLAARLATAPLMVIMLMALSTAKASDISSLNDLLGTSEYLYLVLLVWLALHGPGKLSADHYVWRRKD